METNNQIIWVDKVCCPIIYCKYNSDMVMCMIILANNQINELTSMETINIFL